MNIVIISKTAYGKTEKAAVRLRLLVVGAETVPGVRALVVLLGRLGKSDLVDHRSDTALKCAVRYAVAGLIGHHCLCGSDAKRGKQTDHWVCALADASQPLQSSDLGPDHGVRLGGNGLRQTHAELVDDEQEEDHGDEPADPTREEVTVTISTL